MKTMKYNMIFGIALVCVILFTACDNIVDTPVSGYGRISISFAEGETAQQARTVMPSTVFDKYVYTFTKAGETTGVELSPDNEGVFTLEFGNYTVAVLAYTGNAEPYTLAASGVSSSFSVSSGSNPPVTVLLSRLGTGGSGEFRYTITYPTGTTAEITLQKWSGTGLDDITLAPVNTTQGNGKTQTLSLEIGSYLLTVLVNKTGLYAGISEAVHIYPSLVTIYAKNFNDQDMFADIPPTVNDYTISGVGTFTYDGSAKTVDITRKAIASSGTITVLYNGTATTPEDAGTYTVTFNVEAVKGWGAATGLPAGTIIINKADGAAVSAPTLNSVTQNSITINPVTAPENGQGVQYTIGTTNTVPSGWQDGTTFSGLTDGTTYYIFARSAQNTNYNTGAASASLQVTTNVIVTFNANGGNGAVPSMTVQVGSSITLPSGSGLSKNRSVFSGWNTDADGTGTNYDAGSSYAPTANITLYAKWNPAPPLTYAESVKEVTFTGSTATVTLDNLNGHDIYLVKVNTSDLVVNAASTGSANVPSLSLQNTNENPLPSGEALPRMGHPAADEFFANPPPIIEEAPRRQRALFVPAVVGNTRNFFVETYYNSRVFVAKQATLRATGQYGNIWIMDENYGSGTSANKITSGQAQTLAQKFDQIYPLETKLIGYEYGGGPGGDGGKDGDPKIQILVYDIVDASGASAGVGGFFWPKDFSNTQDGTNLAEIFYINASTVINSPNFTYSALIHEFQHMIHYNMKTVKYRDPITNVGLSSASWYTEMLSLMAEDVIAPLIDIPPTNSSHVIRTRMPTALTNYYSEGITEWGTLTSTSYAKAFAFGAYLMRNYGGAELLQKILYNDKTDVESVTLALQEVAGIDFEQALKRYGEAMIYSGSSMPEGVLTFDKTVTKTISGTAYTAYGFDVWNDYGTTTPSVLSLSQRQMSPHSISVHSYYAWENRTGDLSITLNKPSDPNVVLYLAVK